MTGSEPWSCETACPGATRQLLHVVELDAVGREFEPYLTTGCVCAAAPLWCGLGPGMPIPEQSRFNKAAAIATFGCHLGDQAVRPRVSRAAGA